jgi:phospholipase C
VCRENFDHTSVLQFLEQLTGVHEPNISDWRVAPSVILPPRFVSSTEANPYRRCDTSGSLRLAKYTSANLRQPVFPGQEQQFPEQEKGSREHTFKK